MSQKIVKFFASPFFLAIIPTIVLIFYSGDYFTKYKTELVYTDTFPPNIISYFYDDLDNDGTSERIEYLYNIVGKPAVKVVPVNTKSFQRQRTKEQYNFEGSFFGYISNCIYSGDYNDDNIKEIYILTLENDSLILNSVTPFAMDTSKRVRICIDTIKKNTSNKDIHCNSFRVEKLDEQSKNKSIIISLRAGFSLYPRAVYKIDIDSKKVIKSPINEIACSNIEIIDIDNDGKKEIFVSNGSPRNSNDSSKVFYNDHHTWFLVYDNELNYKFPPIKFAGDNSSINLISTDSSMGNCIFAIHSSAFDDGFIKKYDNQFNLINEYQYSGKNIFVFVEELLPNLLVSVNDTLIIFDNNLKVKKKYYNKAMSQINMRTFDFYLDGKKELVAYYAGDKSIRIFDTEFNEIVALKDYNISSPAHKFYNTLYRKNNEPIFVIFTDKEAYHFKIEKNPLYHFNVLIYLLLFFAVAGIIYLIQLTQKKQLEKKYELEKQIAGLQIQGLKNQLDPHFLLNALNTVGALYLEGDTEKADSFFSKYSRLVTNVLQNSDKITVSLNEELSFVENYISLQQVRHDHMFDFKVIVEPSIDVNFEIPKMLIHTYAENSIKHGLRNLEGRKGKLNIFIRKIKNGISIEIEDNGIGRKKAEENKSFSTGKGLTVIEQLIGYYAKYSNQKISHKIIDLLDYQKKPCGTRVEILIEN